MMNSLEAIEKLEKENIRLKKWVSDLQSGMYVNCVYCGHRYGSVENTPVSMADVLKEHVEKCSKHPMSKLRAEKEVAVKQKERNIYAKILQIIGPVNPSWDSSVSIIRRKIQEAYDKVKGQQMKGWKRCKHFIKDKSIREREHRCCVYQVDKCPLNANADCWVPIKSKKPQTRREGERNDKERCHSKNSNNI